MALGLRLHQSHFGEFTPVEEGKKRPNRWGRIINVERTCGGGGRGAKRRRSWISSETFKVAMQDVLKEVENAIELSGKHMSRISIRRFSTLCVRFRVVATEILSEFSKELQTRPEIHLHC